MALRSLTFHLPEEATPSVMLTILDVWAASPERIFTSAKDVLESVRVVRDIPNRTESVNFALRLRLVSKSAEGLLLSPLAVALTTQRDAVRHDLMHFLAYTAWDPGSSDDSVPFWSYRSTCDMLWQLAPVRVDAQRDQLVEHVITTSQAQFSAHPSYDPDHVSYSRKSLRSILKWLESLVPAVVSDGCARRRTACSSELLLLAIGQAYLFAGAELGVELTLTARIRDVISRICLVDPAYLDRLLDWGLSRHPLFVERADQSSSYGRSVRLRSLPSVESILADR